MKKNIAVLALSLFVFTACSSDGKNTETTEATTETTVETTTAETTTAAEVTTTAAEVTTAAAQPETTAPATEAAAPKPEPVQTPELAPAPEPEPVQTPEPAPAPEPEPVQTPEPAPTASASDAEAYIGASVSELTAALGQPNSSSYAPSCLGEGEDGELHYNGFVVYTYRENGSEVVDSVESE